VSEDVAEVAVLPVCEIQEFLWNLQIGLLAFGGDVFSINVVIRRIMFLLVPKRIFLREDPPDNQRNESTDQVTPSDDTPGDIVPWFVFGLPHKWSDSVSDTVGDQKDSIGRNSFGVTRSDGGDPGENEDKPGQTEIERPHRTQKSNLVFPWQEGDEKTSQEVRDNAKRDNVRAGVGDACRKLNCDENDDDFNHTVDTPKQGGLKGSPSKGSNDDGTLVQE